MPWISDEVIQLLHAKHKLYYIIFIKKVLFSYHVFSVFSKLLKILIYKL